MSFSDNPAVRKAYDDGTYTDAAGIAWKRGMDGWFWDMGADGVMLSRHGDFVALIERENPWPAT
jgi:hypothetical protein